MAKKYLDYNGLSYFWGKIKAKFSPATNWLNGSATGSVRTSKSWVEDSNYTIGPYAVAEGYNTKASGDCSHAEGAYTTSSGEMSHASGFFTIAQRASQTVIGEFNEADTTGSTSSRGDYAFIVGNGASSSARSNAYALEWDGDSTQAGRATTKDMTSAEIATFISGLGGLGSLLFDAIYPVGSYYETSDSTFNPNNSFVGTWELEAEGLVHIGSGTNYAIGATGGEKTHTLTSSESGMPSHRHLDCNGGYNVHDAGSWASRTAPANQTGNTPFINNQTYTSYASANASSAHNNMQPYVVVNRWHRTA